MAKAAEQKASPQPEVQQGRTLVKWDTASLRSSYANFCNANSTREEVVLNFGVNKTWERGPQESLEIELNHPHRAESVCRKAADRAIEQAHTGVREPVWGVAGEVTGLHASPGQRSSASGIISSLIWKELCDDR